MRHLQAGRLVELESGLWAIDDFQPVAAMLDPVSGEVRGVVSWPELPPAVHDGAWPGPQVFGDGSSLWVQQQASGPLVRVRPDGVAMAAWTGDLHLAACGPGVAWCRPHPPQQVLVLGAEAHPAGGPHPDHLLRVAADGHCVMVAVESTVRWVQAEPDALMVEVDVGPWHLRHLGTNTYEVVWSTRWLRLPWEARVPEMLSVHSHGLPVDEGPSRSVDDGGRVHTVWYEPDEQRAALRRGGRQWHLGAPVEQRPRRGWGYRKVMASVHDDGGALERRWQLGDGEVRAVATVGQRLAVAVARRRQNMHRQRMAVDILALDATTDDVRVLCVADSVDITERCWPLVPQPLDADSYCQQVLAANDAIDDYWQNDDGTRGPLSEGISQARACLTGLWPDTCLEWTFSFERYPGLVLRRRVSLFDELGRAVNPEFATIHLMEALETGALPPTSAAHDGFLDL